MDAEIITNLTFQGKSRPQNFKIICRKMLQKILTNKWKHNMYEKEVLSRQQTYKT